MKLSTEIVKSQFVHILLDGGHFRNVLQMQQEGSSQSSHGGYLCVNFTMRLDGAAILQTEAIKLSKVAHTSTAIMRKENTFVEVEKAMVNSVKAFWF